MPGALRHRIQTPVHPIGEIDVRGARALEQAGVASRAAGAIAMGRGIIGAEVGFGLDDSTGGAAASELDRKSTRLNSSHTVISYAVFCLKKKKKKGSTETEIAN